jgi:hypothetical protein
VTVHFPEYGKKGASFCSAVLHYITHVNIEIARIPNPGGLLGEELNYGATENDEEN